MKSPQFLYRLIIDSLVLSTIFACIRFQSPSSANAHELVNGMNHDSIMPELSKTFINAPNAPDALDAEPFISINDVAVSEGDSGTTDAVFSVILSESYTQTVSVNYDTEDGTATSGVDYISASDILTFSVGITTQLITIPILGDTVDEINETFTINLTNAVNGILDDATGLGTIIDDDSAEITVSPLSLTTSETGTSDEFSLVLSIRPTNVVHITLVVTDSTEGALSEEGFVFNSQNWDTPHPITITGLDDPEYDGDITYTIQIQARSNDNRYDDIPTDDIIVTNLDDESPVVVSPLDLTTSEFEDTDTFTVSLTTAPTATVTIALSSSDLGEGTVSSDMLSFTTVNWATPQLVTVRGVDDDIDDGDQPYTIVTGPALSADPNYDGLDVWDVSVTNLDNDGGHVTVTADPGLQTTESGGSITFDVVLDSIPNSNVTIPMVSSDEGEGQITSPVVPLVFTPGNWSIAQTVTVTGQDDDVDDGDVDYTINLGPASSSDPEFNNLVVDNVSVTNIDNDGIGISVYPITGLLTTEAGGSDTFSIVLASQPTANVTIPVVSSDEGEGRVDVAELIFTSSDWSTPQTVTVTGQDDAEDDGNIIYTIITEPAISLDPLYNTLNAANVSVTNLNDDNSPVAVSDSYITNQDLLSVPAPGVLANDVDADGQNTMSALLDQDVDHGSLSFNQNGSFEYIPDLTFNGEDNFSYSVTDDTNSDLATVSIVVDRILPTVNWSLPWEEGLFYYITEEIIRLCASATDNFKIEYVRYYRWDASADEFVDIRNVYSAPFCVDFNTRVLNQGFNQIFIRAYDSAGNRSDRTDIWIFQENLYIYLPLMFP